MALLDIASQPEYPGAKPEEIATLYVAGRYYSDWETVWVQNRWHDPFNYFRFASAERDPIPGLWDRLQWVPGDSCGIYLARRLAMTGIILVRQVAYEAESHGVSLQGKGKAWELTSSILPDEGDGGNFKGDLISIASQVLAPTNVRLAPPVGTIDGTLFNPPEGVHFNQGDTRWAFIERLSRTRNVDLANDKDGNLVLVGPHGPRVSAVLIEGENIHSAQVVINGEDMYSFVFATGQAPPDDQNNGPRASELRSKAVPPGILPEFRPLLVPIEHPVKQQHEVDLRALKEARWSGVRIDADITVYGWLDPTGKLWQVGTEVEVDSPMVPIKQMLSIETATFTQDSTSGSRTQLHLIETWRNNSSGGPATLPSATADTSTPTTKPATATPPDALPPLLPEE